MFILQIIIYIYIYIIKYLINHGFITVGQSPFIDLNKEITTLQFGNA